MAYSIKINYISMLKKLDHREIDLIFKQVLILDNLNCYALRLV